MLAITCFKFFILSTVHDLWNHVTLATVFGEYNHHFARLRPCHCCNSHNHISCLKGSVTNQISSYHFFFSVLYSNESLRMYIQTACSPVNRWPWWSKWRINTQYSGMLEHVVQRVERRLRRELSLLSHFRCVQGASVVGMLGTRSILLEPLVYTSVNRENERTFDYNERLYEHNT